MSARVLWPERFSLYDLMRQRVMIGEGAFESEHQSNPHDPSLSEWPEEYFNWPGLMFAQWPDVPMIKVLSLDPSKGQDAEHFDYRAFVKLGMVQSGLLYVEADLERRPPEVIVEEAVEYSKIWRPDAFAIEINQFQELFIADIQRVAERERVVINTFGLNNQVNKAVRIRRLGPYLSQRKFRFKAKSRGTELLLQQLKDFPNGSHDDGPDGLEMALRQMIDLWNGGLRR
jgi:predicted phage terminase large subunit-like protein